MILGGSILSNIVKKNFIWNMIGSLTIAIPSLFFLIIVTRINGKNEAGVFTFAFSLASLFQVIAYYSGRTFQVTNRNKSITNSDFLYNRITTSIIMFIVVMGYLTIKGYDNYKSLVIILFVIYRFIEAISDSFYAVIQQNNELYKVGISMFCKGLISILLFFIVDLITNNIIISILTIIIAYLIILILYDIKNCKKILIIEKYNNSNNIKLLIMGFSVFVFTFLTQYILNAPRYAIDNYLSSSDQAIYGIIVMPATLIVLCSQFIIQPFLVSINDKIKNLKYKELMIMSIKIIFSVIVIGIIAIGVAYVAGIPLLQLVYNIKLDKYLLSLLIIIAGAIFFSISFIISTILIALRKNSIQIVIYIIGSIFIYFCSNFMVAHYKVLGASISYGLTMFLLFILYIIYYLICIIKKIKECA